MFGVWRWSFGRKRRKCRVSVEKPTSRARLSSCRRFKQASNTMLTCSNHLITAPNWTHPSWPRRPVQTYNKELHWLVQRASVVAQLSKHRRTPPQARGPRGPMVSYFGTLTGFHSAPSQPIVNRRHGRALDVLEREHGAGNVSHQALRSGLSSNVLPSPPTVFRTLRVPEASGPFTASSALP